MSGAAGKRDLTVLLQTMEPRLDVAEYVFCRTSSDASWDPGLDPVVVVREDEGVTLVAERERAAAAGLRGTFPCRRITLGVHSDLAAVGFLARVATELAAHGVSTNAVAGYYHDHLFVPSDRASEAMDILARLARHA